MRERDNCPRFEWRVGLLPVDGGGLRRSQEAARSDGPTVTGEGEAESFRLQESKNEGLESDRERRCRRHPRRQSLRVDSQCQRERRRVRDGGPRL